jgi:4-carboxymuconolactone decarboxylase
MHEKRAVILAGIFIWVCSLATISEAQTMKSEGLNAKQEQIVTIAAFTAKGDLPPCRNPCSTWMRPGPECAKR